MWARDDNRETEKEKHCFQCCCLLIQTLCSHQPAENVSFHTGGPKSYDSGFRNKSYLFCHSGLFTSVLSRLFCQGGNERIFCIGGYSSIFFAFVVLTQPQPQLCPSPQFQRLHSLAPLVKVLPSILEQLNPGGFPGRALCCFESPASGFRTLSLFDAESLHDSLLAKLNTLSPLFTHRFSPEFSLHSVTRSFHQTIPKLFLDASSNGLIH